MRTSPASRIALAACLFACLAPATFAQRGEQPAATADILNAVPANAWAALMVRNLGELDIKLSTLSQQLNVPAPSMLMMAKASMGLMTGINDQGGMAIVLMPQPNFMDVMPGIAVIVPVSDFNAFTAALQGQDVEGEPGMKKIVITNQESYAAPYGAFAVIAQMPGAVKQVLAGDAGPARAQWTPHEVERFAADDVMLWLNGTSIVSGEAFAQIMPMMQMMSQGTFSPEQIQGWRGTTVALRLDKSGLRLGFYVGAKEGSPNAAAMASLPTTNKSLLTGLPGEKYLMAFGMQSSKESAANTAQALSGALANPMVMSQVNPQSLESIKTSLAGMITDLREAAFSIAALPTGPDGIVGFAKVVAFEGDAAGKCASFGDLLSQVTGGMIQDPQMQEQISQIVSYRAGAETIGGTSVDHFVVDLDKIPNAQPQWINEVKQVLGQEGVLVRVAAVDGTHVAATLGGGQARMQKVIELVKSNSAPLSANDGIRQVAGALPDKRGLEGYLSVSNLMSTAAEIAKIANEMPPPAFPNVSQPAAMVGGPVGQLGYQLDVLMPTELIVAFKDMAMSQAMPAQPAPATGDTGQ